ncbi:MAG: TVP38/TMEM64 family protein [Gemmatimonadetes bacterium]|nr:TVP38/TMEM64 family protein [Gemmatimonadota bacterium]
MRTRIIVAIGAAALIALGAWQWEWDVSWLESWIGQHAVLGAGMYVVIVAASVVFLPFSSLPLLPLATRSYGVVLTALLSAAGWWAGSLIAFQVARRARRYVERMTSLEAIDRLEAVVPEDVGFGGIVVLRLILPVDVVSFALGLLKRLRFRAYAMASVVGILPFAFVWSYAGGQLGAGRLVSFALVVTGMTAVVLVARRLWKAYR